MDTTTILQYTLAILGAAHLVFGMLLVGSDQFFHFWENRYWKQDDRGHEKKETKFYNRYVTGISGIAIGFILTYFAFFVFTK